MNKLNSIFDPPCECNLCEPDMVFECPGCLRDTVPYCQGQDDDYYDYCTPCFWEQGFLFILNCLKFPIHKDFRLKL